MSAGRRAPATLAAAVTGLATLAFAGRMAAQQGAVPGGTMPDSSTIYGIETIVVTAERARTPLAISTAAVSVIRAEELRALPVRDLADALQQLPGFAFVDFDGLGGDPQPMVRGFYGGGEAEYLVVLLDGKPLGDLRSGLINWNLVPLAAIDRIEIVRGGASSLYGDAAVGGVINVITKSGEESTASWSLAAGELGSFQGSGALSTELGGRSISLFGNVQRTEGFREHARRWSGSAGGSLALLAGPDASLVLSVLAHRRGYNEPGPLAGDALQASRNQSVPFYRFDEVDERLLRLAVDAGADLASAAQLSGYLAVEHRREDGVGTLVLTPEFADSKDRAVRASRLLGSVQVELDDSVLPWQGQLVAGTDFSVGRARSAYFGYLRGSEETYRQATPARGGAVARGDAARTAAAVFLRAEARPISALTLALGGRIDWLHDAFDPRAPSQGEHRNATHVAFSPKAGINVRYLETASQAGHLYANIGRSFKAPTLDQLFDQRPVPVPFPPFAISTSNALLEPQYGTSIEVGLYHRANLLPGRLAAELSVAVYQMDMEDELDFDLQQFKYVNIGRSRHRGIEAGLKLHGPAATNAFINYTLQDVVSGHGEHAGKHLKAIPRHVLSGGVSAAHSSGLAASLLVTSTRGIWLDDANTLDLPGYTRLDARLSFPIGGLRLAVDVSNLLDSAYSTTGFPDPAGSGVVYYYPAAGRVIGIGLSTGT